MKRITTIFLIVLSGHLSMIAQTDTTAYSVVKNMPVFYEQLKQQLTYPAAWGNSPIRKFDKWRAQARETLLDCMQILPPAPADYAMTVIATEQRNGYKAQKILFNVSEWCRIPAYLLVPDGDGPFPAVVMLHDHGAHFSIGKEKMVRPFGVSAEIIADADNWAAGCYDGQYTGDYFAEHGYVVLSIDALFWGERGRKEGVNYDGQQALASNFLQMGSSWGAFINMDDVRSAEFVASLPFVDKDKVGCVGFSMGAYRSWMLSAITDCIKVSASICWMNTTEHLMTLTNNQNKGGSAYSMLIPNLRRYLDYPHTASIACPKPTLFFNGSRDKLFPVEGVKDAYDTMQAVWQSQKAADRLVTKIWEEKHFFNKEMQKETLEFFNKWLKKSVSSNTLTMRRIGIFLILCVIATGFCFGQLPHTFTQYTSEDGLSQNTIMSILQDDKGVMWFATWDGLYKFDGYTFNNYKAHPGDSIGLSNNRLDNIKEDRYGYIWVQSYNHQVYRFNPRLERFQAIHTSPHGSTYMSNDR